MPAIEIDTQQREQQQPPVVQIKGYGILGMFRYIKESGFPCGVQGLMQYGDKDLRARFNQKIVKSQWYPYEHFKSLIALMDKVMGKQDPEFLRKLGYQAATADAGTGFKLLTILSSPESIVRVAMKCWRWFCDAGEFELLRCDANQFDLKLYNLPGIDPRHCQIFAGWLEGMALACGAVTANAVQLNCAGQGGSHCTFRCTYQMRHQE